jgi:toxin HigB-1
VIHPASSRSFRLADATLPTCGGIGSAAPPRPTRIYRMDHLVWLIPLHTLIAKCRSSRYSQRMIGSFKSKRLKRLYEKGDQSVIGATMLSRVEEILSVLEAAETVEEMNIPGYRLHSLTGNLHGYWSVRVTGNWRIVFRFENGEALDVDLDDYH